MIHRDSILPEVSWVNSCHVDRAAMSGPFSIRRTRKGRDLNRDEMLKKGPDCCHQCEQGIVILSYMCFFVTIYNTFSSTGSKRAPRISKRGIDGWEPVFCTFQPRPADQRFDPIRPGQKGRP